MDIESDKQPLVDPELRAFVFNRVSSLGGSSAADDGRYVLGDDLLPSLKDIRDWLRHFNDKLNRLDVARLLAEANLVQGDLLEILAGWPDAAAEDSFRSKVALRCVDLLMQLTWPVDRNESSTTQNLLFHKPYVQTAQASYKQAILRHHGKILRKAGRAGLPAIAQPQRERSAIDESIINVVLYLFRNVAMIRKPDHVSDEEDDSEISRSATIEAYHDQDTFDLLLAIGSGIGDEFQHHDLELLDVLFHLVKGIGVDRLFMDKEHLVSSNTRELQSLIGKERNMHLVYNRHAPSRHNRFGTMVWMKRDNGKMSTLMGQTATTNDESTLQDIDNAKKWKKPRRPVKRASTDPIDELNEFNGNVPLTGVGRKHLRSFVERFLDSSFNPLFLAVRKSIEREVPRLQQYHTRQFFFLVSWFLRVESVRRRNGSQTRNLGNDSRISDSESFNLVAGVLTQQMFVLLCRKMQDAHDTKNWQDLNACMKCFTQILQTVQEMAQSQHEEDQEIAENMLSRIFYEQSTHDQIITLLRTFKDQGFGYLDSLTDFAHVFIRTLEQYSKQNVDMQVRSMRRSRKKKAAADSNQGTSDNMDKELESTDKQEAQRISTDRKFDFMSFSAKIINQHSIETFVNFLKYFKELDTEQLKRAHRFFYRAAFKTELCVYLFRMDIILLLQRLVRGPDGMNQEDPMLKEWEELVRQIFRRLIKKMQQRSSLGVELLFSKIPSTVYYLEHGYDKEVPKATPRPPADLEVKPGMSIEDQIGVAVSVLINQHKADHVAWVKQVLHAAMDERKAWEGLQEAQAADQGRAVDAQVNNQGSLFGAEASQEQTHESAEAPAEASADSAIKEVSAASPSPILVRPDTPQRRMAMQKDKHLRLLLTLLGFDKLDITESDIDRDGFLTSWTIPPSQSSNELQRLLELVGKHEFSPPTYDDGKSAEDFLRRKQNPTSKKAEADRDEDSDSEGDSQSEGDEGALFPAGGPTARKADHSPKRSHKRARKQREPLSDDAAEEAKAARRRTEKAKAAKIKSRLMISVSDDEEDNERDRSFFEREAEMRKRQAREVQNQSMRLRGLLQDGYAVDETGALVDQAGNSIQAQSLSDIRRGKKRSLEETASDDDDDDDGAAAEDLPLHSRKKTRRSQEDADDLALSSDSDALNELSSEDSLPPRSRRRRRSIQDLESLSNTEDERPEEFDDQTPPSSQRPSSGHGEDISSGKIGTPRSMPDDADVGSDKENAGSKTSARNKTDQNARVRQRAAFVIDSDSDE
ncbi:MAG: hypothetical protein Q9159_005567 [Coniocarpon cinnabarinum]